MTESQTSEKSIMSDMFTCDDKETLVAYLYDEVDAADRRESTPPAARAARARRVRRA